MKKILLIALALAACLITLVAAVLFFETRAERAGVAFTLENAGSKPLRTVVVKVTGRSYELGEMAPGTIKMTTLHPAGESHIELEFSPGRRLIIDCYIEPGYSGSIRAKVTSQAVVAVDDKTKVAPY